MAANGRENAQKRMATVKQSGTSAEKRVRTHLAKSDIPYRINAPDLPGTPDIVVDEFATVIFVHGCFWHRHVGCHKASMPARNQEFWRTKFEANKARDQQKIDDLTELGYEVLIVWECETDSPEKLASKLSGLASTH